MTVSDIINDTRVAHVRELKAEIARLKADLATAQNANAEWEHHFALALLAARDADRLPAEGRLFAIDGWNIVFNATGELHHDKAALIARLHSWAQVHPNDFLWLVFDGNDENAAEEANLRVSYTGGTGPHRADRLIVDFARMLKLTGRAPRLVVVTGDKDFRAQAKALGAEVQDPRDFLS